MKQLLHKYRSFRRHLEITACLLLVASPLIAAADSWGPPKTEIYSSENQQYRFVVVPKWLENDHDSKGISRLEKVISEGEHKILWQRQLTNSISPVDAIVSNSGKYVATFDNWGSLGIGADTVVVFAMLDHRHQG